MLGQMLSIGIAAPLRLYQPVIMVSCPLPQGKDTQRYGSHIKIKWCKQKQQEC